MTIIASVPPFRRRDPRLFIVSLGFVALVAFAHITCLSFLADNVPTTDESAQRLLCCFQKCDVVVRLHTLRLLQKHQRPALVADRAASCACLNLVPIARHVSVGMRSASECDQRRNAISVGNSVGGRSAWQHGSPLGMRSALAYGDGATGKAS